MEENVVYKKDCVAASFDKVEISKDSPEYETNLEILYANIIVFYVILIAYVTSTTIIGGSDGPTSVFILGGHQKLNIKQRVQKKIFQLRKKWYALWIKPGVHTMDEVAHYIKEKYHFTELSVDSEKYRFQYDELRTSFMIQYQLELLG